MPCSSPKAEPYFRGDARDRSDECRAVVSCSATRVQPSTCFTRVEARRPVRLEPLGGNGPQREPELFHPRVCVRWALQPPARIEPNRSFLQKHCTQTWPARLNNGSFGAASILLHHISVIWLSEHLTQDLHRPLVDGSWDAWQQGRHIPAVHFLTRPSIVLCAIQPTWRQDLIAAEEYIGLVEARTDPASRPRELGPANALSPPTFQYCSSSLSPSGLSGPHALLVASLILTTILCAVASTRSRTAPLHGTAMKMKGHDICMVWSQVPGLNEYWCQQIQ